MPDQGDISLLCQRIVQHFTPERIVLFGSHATGTATPASDVDLLVVMEYDGTPGRAAVEILHRLDAPFGVDILVRTPEQLADRMALNDLFFHEIMEKGRVLYARGNARVDREG